MQKVFKTILEFGIYAAIVAGIVWGVPNFLSWKLGTQYPIAAITSGSMWPSLHTGDLVLKKVPKEELSLGDIVVWENSQGFTIHRIVKLNADTLVTKGDANFTEDVPVAYDDVVGRNLLWSKNAPVRIPYLGYISVWGAGLKSAYAQK